jgi:epoxyqueuosine reductase
MTPLRAELLRERARELGLDVVRVTHVAPLDNLAIELASRISSGLLPESLIRDDHHLRRRCEPAIHLRGARTVICTAVGYHREGEEGTTKDGQLHGRIGRYTWCDYYGELRAKLKELAAWIRHEVPGTRSVAYSNYTSLAEKPLAVRSGIGWQGKNSLVLNHSLGSWLVLGELVTQLEIEPDDACDDGCGTCDECVRACPTGALVAPGVLDARRCIQHRCGTDGPIPVAMREVWKNRLYGCDTCQEVCPYNHDRPSTSLSATRGCVGASVPLLPLFSMTPEQIRDRFAGNQMAKSWVKPEYLLRNAAICLGNLGDPAAVPTLSEALINPSPLVRGAAAWALGQFGDGKASSALSARRTSEPDPEVVSEIRAALEGGDSKGAGRP